MVQTHTHTHTQHVGFNLFSSDESRRVLNNFTVRTIHSLLYMYSSVQVRMFRAFYHIDSYRFMLCRIK